MLSVFLYSLLIQVHPEMDRGPTLEMFGGGAFVDREEAASEVSGLRLSYSRASKEDAFITGEVQVEVQNFIPKDSEDAARYFAEANLMFYEIYKPFVFRAGAGGGIERRSKKFNPSLAYRGGLGYFWASNWTLYSDLTGRYIWRSELSLPVQWSLSVMHIF